MNLNGASGGPCRFLAEKVGSISLDEIKQHLGLCEDCPKFFEVVYDYYLNKDPAFFSGWSVFEEFFDLERIPAGLDRDNFLPAWHLFVAKKTEEMEFRMQKLLKRINSERAWHIISDMFLFQNIVLKLLGTGGTNWELREKYLQKLLDQYRFLQEYLGPSDFSLLFGIKDQKELEWILLGWRRATTEGICLQTSILCMP